jgi:endonuclease YncB( thermonuclease family)
MDEYNAVRAPRGSARTAFTTALSTSLDHSGVAPETRIAYKQALFFFDEAEELRARLPQNDTSWREMRDEGIARFKVMLHDDVLNKLPLVSLYNKAYGRGLGEFDWEPDEPAALSTDGELSPFADQVYVRQILDGDTLVVSLEGRGKFLGLVNQEPENFAVRMLGINAREMGEDGGTEDKYRLQDAIEEAIDAGTPIYVVRDPDRYSNTDYYGRQFSWLYIGDEPYYFPETMIPER